MYPQGLGVADLVIQSSLIVAAEVHLAVNKNHKAQMSHNLMPLGKMSAELATSNTSPGKCSGILKL